ncbi:MAG TPA: hypothetical protein VHU13_10290 [Solirubrobacteraceae bacterium]|nr:hypothetical protein [Solirubrobacteraceae bacterium]
MSAHLTVPLAAYGRAGDGGAVTAIALIALAPSGFAARNFACVTVSLLADGDRADADPSPQPSSRVDAATGARER